MPAVEVRPVVESDLPRLMGLDHSSTTERVWQLQVRREVRGPEVSAIFREVKLPRPVRLAYPNDPFALADEWTRKVIMVAGISADDAVGYLGIVEPRPARAWVTDLVVAPGWRRQGVASALLGFAQEWAAERGGRRLFLEMQSKNYPAIRLAQKHGYEFCGYNDHYYSTQDIALFFTKAL